jgi:aconitate hydratase 2/2-methylisocitrate dehydratase
MKFMNDFGLITARDPKGEYHAMTDVIHKVLNDITVMSGLSLLVVTRILECQKELRWCRFGTVALALATGEAVHANPESVK